MADEDLGSMMPPEDGGNTWTKIASDPKALAAMTAFGLRLMQGGWGNGAQQIAGAMGGAANAVGETAASQLQQQNLNREVALKESEGEATRASHEKIAKIGADSRNEVAQIRSEAMMERARLIHGPQNNQEMNIYSKAAADYMKKEKDNQLISKKPDDQIKMEADAWGKSVLKNARDAAGVRSIGAPLPSDESGAGSPAGMGSAGTTPTPGKAAASDVSAPNAQWDKYVKSLTPDELKILQTNPAARKAVGDKNPSFRPFLDKLGPETPGVLDKLGNPGAKAMENLGIPGTGVTMY